MPNMVFQPGITRIPQPWGQEINDFYWDLLLGSTTVSQARQALGVEDPSLINVSSTSYSITSSSNNAYIVTTNSSPVTITINQNVISGPASITVVQLGTGQVTISAGSGVTINTPEGSSTRAQYSVIGLSQTTSNTWVLSGDLAA